MRRFLNRLLCLLLSAAIVAALLPQMTGAAGYAEGYKGGMAGEDNGIYAHGVDLSNWQGHEVDFNRIKEQGYSFVILRAGFATTEDDTFEENYARAKAAGLDVGVYLYSYAGTVEEVLRESAALKTWLSGKLLEYPVYYDMEDPSIHAQMSAEALTALALAFLDDMAADGWLVGLYSCKSWLDNRLETEKICERYECWMAQYLSDGTYDIYDRYDGMYGMWQYSSSGSVDGVPGYTDMDVCFKDYPSICRQYGFNGYAASGEPLVLSGLAVPSVMACGERFPIEGKVSSAKGKLNNVTVGVYDETGAMVTGRSAGPRETTYSLTALAEGVKLQELAAGNYEFRVTATDSSQTRILLKQSLVVSPAGVRSDELTFPQDLKEGAVFQPMGRLSASSELKEVSVLVFTADGKEAGRSSAQPNETEFDLAALVEPLQVQTLSPGIYHYCVEAVTQKGRETLLSENFTVWVRNDPITLAGFSMKSEYRTRELTGLNGVVSSQSSPLRCVSVTVSDRHGQIVASASSERQKMQVSLAEFQKKLSLRELPVGTYTCRIEALNAGGPCLVAEQSFLLRDDSISLCELSAPYCMREGDTFLLDGAVTSDESALAFVGVTVTDEEGRLVLDVGTVPDDPFCDLRVLGERLLFSTLLSGEYTLKICAENGKHYQTLYEEGFTVTQSEDRILWTGERFALAGTICYAGDGVNLWGTLASERSALKRVRAEILDTDGTLITGAFQNTEAYSFDIAVFNEMLHFSALPRGEYCLRILAENASGEALLCSEYFGVTDCSHTNACSGEVYSPTCERRGAICDSRCLDCGAKVRSGRILPEQAHTMQDGVCTLCGRTDHLSLRVRVTDKELCNNGRYVIACREGDMLYALHPKGETVRLSENGDGSVTVSADLLWMPVGAEGDVLSLVDATGRRLHLDSDAVRVGRGWVNTVLFVQHNGGAYSLCLQDDRTRWLSFSDGRFSTSGTPWELCFLELEQS